MSELPILPARSVADASAVAVGYVAVTLNGESVKLPAASTLADLLALHGLDPHTHATARNGMFVAREQRADVVLQPGDAVMCFQAIVGG